MIVIEDFLPRERFTAFRAAVLMQTAEVISTMTTNEVLNRDGLGPIELQSARRTLGFGQAAKVLAATRTTNLERDDVPVGRCYFGVTIKCRSWSMYG